MRKKNGENDKYIKDKIRGYKIKIFEIKTR